jgi:hypothetical protein
MNVIFGGVEPRAGLDDVEKRKWNIIYFKNQYNFTDPLPSITASSHKPFLSFNTGPNRI